MVSKVALGQIFSEYFGFPYQSLFHQVLHTHRHISSGAGTMGQLVADVPSGLSLPLPKEAKRKKKLLNLNCSSSYLYLGGNAVKIGAAKLLFLKW
jgi:hypothetical protein